jgi:hypothetical protein
VGSIPAPVQEEEEDLEYTPRKCKEDRYLFIGCTKGQVIILDL